MEMTLYEGDCFTVLLEHVPDESVDMVYLDPPFYTNAIELARKRTKT
jgi:site-specific DNA-methyltransferase (adenine-specific)